MSGCFQSEIRGAAKSARVDVGIDNAPRTVALQFEAKKTGTRPLPFPFVDVKVNGQATRFLIDTGATGHSIDRAFAQSAQAADPVRLSAVVVDGWGKLADQPVATVDLPESIRSHGIGGVISPQLLVKAAQPTQGLVVDFVRSQLRSQEKAAARASVEELGIKVAPATPCTSANVGGVAGSIVVVEATVDGVTTKLVADTSTAKTYFADGFPVAAKVRTHPSLGRSVTQSRMTEVPLSLLGGVSMSAGSWTNNAEVGVGAAGSATEDGCGLQGRLGMDALQRCALAFVGDDVVLGCRPPVGP